MAIKISKSRLTLSPFSVEQMIALGQLATTTFRKRIQSGINADDNPTKPLKPGRRGKKGYPEYKTGRGLQPIRDWTWTGHTMRAMGPVSASENSVQIGFTDPRSDRVAHANNQIEKAFGVSPNDREVINKGLADLFNQSKVVQFKRVA